MNIIITGTSKGIGKSLTEYYLKKGDFVFGCSRSQSNIIGYDNYIHFTIDVSNEVEIRQMVTYIRKNKIIIDVLINNAGIASMNHFLLTPEKTLTDIFRTNYNGTFLFSREISKIMSKNKFGRIINFTTVAVPLNLSGEVVYASSKSAIETLTRILAYELSDIGVTINCIGPTPIETNLIKGVPKNKINQILERQAIKRIGLIEDIYNIIDFLIKPESNFITGQTIYLGGVSK